MNYKEILKTAKKSGKFSEYDLKKDEKEFWIGGEIITSGAGGKLIEHDLIKIEDIPKQYRECVVSRIARFLNVKKHGIIDVSKYKAGYKYRAYASNHAYFIETNQLDFNKIPKGRLSQVFRWSYGLDAVIEAGQINMSQLLKDNKEAQIFFIYREFIDSSGSSEFKIKELGKEYWKNKKLPTTVFWTAMIENNNDVLLPLINLGYQDIPDKHKSFFIRKKYRTFVETNTLQFKDFPEKVKHGILNENLEWCASAEGGKLKYHEIEKQYWESYYERQSSNRYWYKNFMERPQEFVDAVPQELKEKFTILFLALFEDYSDFDMATADSKITDAIVERFRWHLKFSDKYARSAYYLRTKDIPENLLVKFVLASPLAWIENKHPKAELIKQNFSADEYQEFLLRNDEVLDKLDYLKLEELTPENKVKILDRAYFIEKYIIKQGISNQQYTNNQLRYLYRKYSQGSWSGIFYDSNLEWWSNSYDWHFWADALQGKDFSKNYENGMINLVDLCDDQFWMLVQNSAVRCFGKDKRFMKLSDIPKKIYWETVKPNFEFFLQKGLKLPDIPKNKRFEILENVAGKDYNWQTEITTYTHNIHLLFRYTNVKIEDIKVRELALLKRCEYGSLDNIFSQENFFIEIGNYFLFKTGSQLIKRSYTETLVVKNFKRKITQVSYLKFLKENFGIKTHKVSEDLKTVQLNEIYEIEKLRSIAGIDLYKRTLAGNFVDYCLFDGILTAHGKEVKDCLYLLRKKKHEIETLKKQDKIKVKQFLNVYHTFHSLSRENGGMFCETGMNEFLQNNTEIDREKAYTGEQLLALASKNKANRKFTYDLQLIGVNI